MVIQPHIKIHLLLQQVILVLLLQLSNNLIIHSYKIIVLSYLLQVIVFLLQHEMDIAFRFVDLKVVVLMQQ